MSETTKHNHGPNFGRKIEGCPRCDELKNGAEPIVWAFKRSDEDRVRCEEIRAHDCSQARCGVVCTFGDW